MTSIGPLNLRLLDYQRSARRPAAPAPAQPPVAKAPAPAPATFDDFWAQLDAWIKNVQVRVIDLRHETPAPAPEAPTKPAPASTKFYTHTDNKQYQTYGATGAIWLTGSKWDPTTIKREVEAARKAGQTPVIAQYAIPGRDHGGPSGGGAKSLEAYKRLVEANAKAIGDAPAMLVVEPDGLALGLSADCVKAAVEIYRKNCPNARIYVDAGHSSWKKPNEVADLLLKGGIAQADGFALNVSAFQWTRDNMAFGDQVIAELAKRDPKLASKQYVIDTSRNGNGPGVDEQGKPTWGDPVRAKNGGPIMNGPLPTTDTGNSHCAAFIWVKGPGHGDNRIHPSGQFGGEAWVKATKNPKLGP